MRAGHERVLRARLADAQFFWEADQKCRLADYLPKLERVTYESRLGSYRDKVERIRAIARWLSEQWYYRDVAPVMLPYLIDRPVVIQRWPDGIDDFDWYQHRVPPRAPDYLRAAWVDGVRRMVIENGDALLWMVNQAGLTYHGFGSRLAVARPSPTGR